MIRMKNIAKERKNMFWFFFEVSCEFRGLKILLNFYFLFWMLWYCNFLNIAAGILHYLSQLNPLNFKANKPRMENDLSYLVLLFIFFIVYYLVNSCNRSACESQFDLNVHLLITKIVIIYIYIHVYSHLFR